MCPQSSTNKGLFDLLYGTVSGLTINGYVDIYLIHPLFSKLVICEATQLSQNKTVKVDQFVNNTIEVHKSAMTPVGGWLNEW
jgi:hypothetical protein